jgi:hypothetical protein
MTFISTMYRYGPFGLILNVIYIFSNYILPDHGFVFLCQFVFSSCFDRFTELMIIYVYSRLHMDLKFAKSVSLSCQISI